VSDSPSTRLPQPDPIPDAGCGSRPPTVDPHSTNPAPAGAKRRRSRKRRLVDLGGSSKTSGLQAGARPVPEYTLLAPLGRGGCGEVWKARDDGGFEVALKFVPLFLEHRPFQAEQRSRLTSRLRILITELLDPRGSAELRGLKVMKNVRHPHVLPMFRSWRVGDWLVLALELGEKTLYHRLGEARTDGHVGIPHGELHEYMREAAKGLITCTA
jgi:serine/threonine protein kinase